MISEISIPRRVIYISATTPSDLTQGRLWVRTTDNKVLVSNGSSYAEVATSTDDLELQQIIQSVSELRATSSNVVDSATDIIVDVFSSATGAKSTIDTGTTDATFTASSAQSVAHGVADDTTGGSAVGGLVLYAQENAELISVTKYAGAGTNVPHVWNATGLGATKGSEISVGGAYSGNVSTFPTPVHLVRGNYYIVATEVAENLRYNNAGSVFPYGTSNLKITATWASGLVTTRAYNYASFSFSTADKMLYTNAGADKIVQTNVITIPAGATSAKVYSKNTLTGTGTITFDLSTDNGSNYQTGQALNTKIALTNVGTQAILKLNLNAGASAGVVTVEDYGIMFYF
jgi:hypothetical protein